MLPPVRNPTFKPVLSGMSVESDTVDSSASFNKIPSTLSSLTSLRSMTLRPSSDNNGLPSNICPTLSVAVVGGSMSFSDIYFLAVPQHSSA
eukprot:CAMPEP_0168519888 /NCGR_PEP_ID=MMETSP0405-20121227/7603_1 /TAXON_ID=498012 /ORGANISM="Trichosphaerium sp, Strain Am-I-7 wt" /LENGTH=90 /DNA_ID=CAMNT_0008540551 /DNA_START=312 /DNA_END=584 /DNA_ORIENTATION=-